jgi:hypothetical protein
MVRATSLPPPHPAQNWQGKEVTGPGLPSLVRVSAGQGFLAQCYLDKPAGCSPGTRRHHPRRAGLRCEARGWCTFSSGRGSPARSPGSRTTMDPRRPSLHSACAGKCSRCAGDPPPGLGRTAGLRDEDVGSPFPSQTSPGAPTRPPAHLHAHRRGCDAIPSVSQAPEPSAGQVLVSVLLLPNCRP